MDVVCLTRTLLTSHHCCGVAPQADRATEELYNAIVKNDLACVYDKIAEGADVNFVFGEAYGSPEGYTPLMVACHRCVLTQKFNKLQRGGAWVPLGVGHSPALLVKCCHAGHIQSKLIEVGTAGRVSCILVDMHTTAA